MTPPLKHGIDCIEAPHTGTGHLHEAGDFGPYDVDGVSYCGKCHVAMCAPVKPKRMRYETYSFIRDLILEQKRKLLNDYTTAIVHFVAGEEACNVAEKKYLEHLTRLRQLDLEFEIAVKESYRDHPDLAMRQFWGWDWPEEPVDKP